jgi:hypothetical protein
VSRSCGYTKPCCGKCSCSCECPPPEPEKTPEEQATDAERDRCLAILKDHIRACYAKDKIEGAVWLEAAERTIRGEL